MIEIIVNGYNEFVEEMLKAEKQGLEVAGISNTGLDLQQRRITFLPKEMVTKDLIEQLKELNRKDETNDREMEANKGKGQSEE